MRAVLGSQAGAPASLIRRCAGARQASTPHAVAQTGQRPHLKLRVGEQPLDRIPVQPADGQLQIHVQVLLRIFAQRASKVWPARRSRRSLCCRLRARCFRFMQGSGCAWCMKLKFGLKEQQVSGEKHFLSLDLGKYAMTITYQHAPALGTTLCPICTPNS